MGAQLVRLLLQELPQDYELPCAATNAPANSTMPNAGCQAAGGSIAMYRAGRADVILGPIGNILTSEIPGRVPAAMAAAISSSGAVRIPIPSNALRCLWGENGRLPVGGIPAPDSQRGTGSVERMKTGFNQILLEHMVRYPLMQPQDYTKLAYQSEFGPGHMIEDPKRVLPDLLEEWKTTAGGSPQSPERIGNGLCRFHLTNEYAPNETAPLLAELFTRTTQKQAGTQSGLQKRLRALQSLRVSGMEEWLSAYQKRGCPSVHHSKTFRKAYQPHYRVISADYANYFPALLAVKKLTQLGKPIVVAIDGRCGSGKSTLAALLAEFFACNVFHMDDYYLPMDQRSSGWMETPAGNMDLDRFLREVLLSTLNGGTVRYCPFDCQTSGYKEAVLLSKKPVTIIEGSYSQHPMLSSHYDLKIFLTCSQDEQARRLRTREGTHFTAFQTRWIPMEERYLQTFDVQRSSTVVLDTSNFLEAK